MDRVIGKEVPYGEKGREEFLYMGHGDLYRSFYLAHY
jgi:hypothetical protein